MGVNSETRGQRHLDPNTQKFWVKKKLAVFALICTNFPVATGFSGDSVAGQEPRSLLAAAP